MTEISEDDLYEMANVSPDDSGLPMTVWARPLSNERHDPRIKVCTVHGAAHAAARYRDRGAAADPGHPRGRVVSG